MSALNREGRRDYRLLGFAAGGLGLLAVFAIAKSSQDYLAFFGVIGDVVAIGYQTAPALTIGILAALGFPLISVLARIAERSRRSREATRLYFGDPLRRGAKGVAGDAEGLHGPAFLEVVGGSGARFPIQRDMVRIGREDDNDIRIKNGSVHRYHAAISREDFDDWRVTDLSGLDGNGLIVNGRRCSEAHLNDGDVIQLGPGRLRFRAGVA